MANKILRLDITKTPELTPIVYGRVGDGLIQTIDVYVTNNGEPFNLTGYTLKFEGNTSGNRSFIQDTENIKVKDLAKGYFTYTFPTTAFSVAGKYEHAYFSFTKGTTRESTSDFDIQIFYNADITAEEAHTVINEYDKLVEELNEIFLKANTDLQEDFTDFKTTYDKKYNDYVSDLTKKVTEAQNKIDILNKNYEVSEKKVTELKNRLQELINNGLLKMEDVVFFLQGKTSVTIDGKVVKVDKVIPTFTFLTNNHYTKTETDNLFYTKTYIGSNFYTKAESSANVIDQVIGKESSERTFKIDFKNKIAESLVENPNLVTWGNFDKLPVPQSVTFENTQQRYGYLAELDNNLNKLSTNQASRFVGEVHQINIVESLKRYLGSAFFDDQGKKDLASQVKLAKQLVSSWKMSVWGFGSCTSGNVFRAALYRDGTWELIGSDNYSNQVKEISFNQNFSRYVQDDGFIYFIAYTDTSDGVTASVINIDYASVDLTLDLSANAHIKSMMAQNRVENLATSEEAESGTDNAKTMTPLRTDQYFKAQLATKEEAEAGLNNTKAMTPLRVFQSIAKWIEDRFINSGYLLDKTHPVGSIYISVNKDDPSKVLGGGTWERFAKGQVLVGVNEDDTDFSTSGKTGGEKAHKLTVAELANHTHKQLFSSGATGIGDVGRSPNANKLENITEAAGITATGGDQPHNNLQPYTTVYIWKRTN